MTVGVGMSDNMAFLIIKLESSHGKRGSAEPMGEGRVIAPASEVTAPAIGYTSGG